jgi:5-methylcytosine-specific restriction endonuclease McrA
MEPRTLILNAWMSPHSIATWQQAICLLVTGKIDVLEEYEAEVSSPSVTIRIPAVARLRKELSTHKKGVKFSRVNVYTRDQFTCSYCGRRLSPQDLNYDHVIPRSRGGRTVWTNVTTSCFRCNAKKGNRTPEEAGLILRTLPYRPRSLPLVRPFIIDPGTAPDQWFPYLAWMNKTA